MHRSPTVGAVTPDARVWCHGLAVRDPPHPRLRRRERRPVTGADVRWGSAERQWAPCGSRTMPRTMCVQHACCVSSKAAGAPGDAGFLPAPAGCLPSGSPGESVLWGGGAGDTCEGAGRGKGKRGDVAPAPNSRRTATCDTKRHWNKAAGSGPGILGPGPPVREGQRSGDRGQFRRDSCVKGHCPKSQSCNMAYLEVSGGRVFRF